MNRMKDVHEIERKKMEIEKMKTKSACCHLLTSLGFFRWDDAAELLLDAIKIPFLDTEDVVEHRRHESVEDNESPNYTEVSPAVTIEDTGLCSELVSNLQRAVLALRNGILVENTTTSQACVFLKILPASLARWWIKDRDLVIGTLDGSVVDLS